MLGSLELRDAVAEIQEMFARHLRHMKMVVRCKRDASQTRRGAPGATGHRLHRPMKCPVRILLFQTIKVVSVHQESDMIDLKQYGVGRRIETEA